MQLVKEIVDNERLRDRADRLQNSTIQVIGIAVEKMEQRHNKGNNWKKNFAESEDQSPEIVSAHQIPKAVEEHRITHRHILVKFWSSADNRKS